MKTPIYIIVALLCLSLVSADNIAGYQNNAVRHYKAVYDGANWYCSLDGVPFSSSGNTGTGNPPMIVDALALQTGRGLLYVDNINISYGTEPTFCDNQPNAYFCDDAETGVMSDKWDDWDLSGDAPENYYQTDVVFDGLKSALFNDTNDNQQTGTYPAFSPIYYPFEVSFAFKPNPDNFVDGFYLESDIGGFFVLDKTHYNISEWSNLTFVFLADDNVEAYVNGVLELTGTAGEAASFDGSTRIYLTTNGNGEEFYFDNFLVQNYTPPTPPLNETVVENITTGVGSEPAQAVITPPTNGTIDLTNVTTLQIVVPTVQIVVDFTGESINYNTLDTTAIVITDKSVSINTVLEPQLNIPATLTFNNVGPGAVILRNGEPCGSYCSNQRYIGTTLTVDVSGFSTYTVSEEVAAGCTNTRNVVFAAFALIAIIIIVTAAFLLIQFGGDFSAFLTLAISSIALAIVLFVGFIVISAVQNAICVV